MEILIRIGLSVLNIMFTMHSHYMICPSLSFVLFNIGSLMYA